MWKKFLSVRQLEEVVNYVHWLLEACDLEEPS